MAFLCPVRIRRGKKKKPLGGDIDKDLSRSSSGLGLNHGLGRITGSASIETLVRVGIEKEHGLSPDSKMVVLQNFTPCVDDELEVKCGQIVNILYRENDWVYVIGQDTRQEGFIPHSYCAPYNTQLADSEIKKKLPREQSVGVQQPNNIVNNNNAATVAVNDLIDGTVELTTDLLDNTTMTGLMDLQSSMLKQSQGSLSSEPEFLPFAKDICGRYIVLYTFIARDENDVSVERGEFVTVLNREDPEWFWIVRSDGQEGFIPSGFVYPADNVLQNNAKASQLANNNNNNNATASQQNTLQPSNNDNGNSIAHTGQMTDAVTTAATNNSTANNNNNASNLISANSNNNTQMQTQSQPHQQQQPVLGGSDDLRYHGTELVMLYDYKAQAPDDLSVRRGDWIYADLNNQTVDGWLWAYAPKTRKYGFIPKAYARTPAMTSL